MITDEAVETGAKALWDVDRESGQREYDDCLPGTKRHLRREARAVLEAATPILMAQAWAAGAPAGFNVSREGFNGEYARVNLSDPDYPPTNPHNGQPWLIDSKPPE